MADLTDLEITKLCAEAMEDPTSLPGSSEIWDVDICYLPGTGSQKITQRVRSAYDPLRNDAQAMALMKNLQLSCDWRPSLGDWFVHSKVNTLMNVSATDLNRAICKCVARIQLERSRG